jgi:ATP-binding cassette subfamily C (CFTR/MRP) protein 1
MDLRKEELVQIRRLAFYRALTFSLVFFLPVLAAVLMFITYSLSGHSLNAAIVFSSLQVRFRPILKHALHCI